MKAGTDRAGDEPGEEWDETVVVWNATVARIPATAVRLGSAAGAGPLAGAEVTPDRAEEARP